MRLIDATLRASFFPLAFYTAIALSYQPRTLSNFLAYFLLAIQFACPAIVTSLLAASFLPLPRGRGLPVLAIGSLALAAWLMTWLVVPLGMLKPADTVGGILLSPAWAHALIAGLACLRTLPASSSLSPAHDMASGQDSLRGRGPG